MKKGMGVSFCCVMLLIWLFSFTCVTAEEYPITLAVTVNDTGSVHIKADGDKAVTHRSMISIYKKGDIIDFNLPYDKQTLSIMDYDLLSAFSEKQSYPIKNRTRRNYLKQENWTKYYRLDTLTDGPNSPLKPGEYFAIAIYKGEGEPEKFLSEPVPFTMGEWERSLRVEQEENGSFAFETKGFFSGCSSVRVYRQGTACDPTTEADEGIVSAGRLISK